MALRTIGRGRRRLGVGSHAAWQQPGRSCQPISGVALVTILEFCPIGARLRISEPGITRMFVSAPACVPAPATALGSAFVRNR